jgi:S-formylglutathione hydrolase FrmB
MSALMDIVPLPGHKAGPNSKVGIMSAKVGELSCSKFIRRADAATIAKMKTIRWYVDCGDRDFLLKKNQEFMSAMDRAGIPYKKQIRKGTHSWQYWHSGLFICLPFISESFAPIQ